ncbi:MAG: MarR family winged helix-turn-helix transcriptional regulator [Bacillota bacterium]
MSNIDLKHAESWIKRYIEADMMVSRRILADTREGIGVELTREQYQVMCLIHNNERCTSTFLADLLFVGKSSITAIVNRLVERNWIERARDEEDRRVVYLTLTENGRSMHQQAELQLQSLVSSYLTHFDEGEVEHFITLYEKLARLMQEHGGGLENENDA